MADTSLRSLAELPVGYAEAAGLIDGIDRCLTVGFSRLGPDQTQTLHALVGAFAVTPLADPLASAVEATGRGEFREGHFATVAVARAALQGAQHDALRKQACGALGRPFEPTPHAEPPAPADGPLATLGESTRHWLMELALAGFKQIDAAALAPFTATLRSLEAEPAAVRQAALLCGFQQELLRSVPIAAVPDVPVHRWADLWTRATVGSFRGSAEPAGEPVSGTFFPVGVDHRYHAAFAGYVLYGLFESADRPPRFVRVTLATYKVDALRGGEVWRVFPSSTYGLIQGLAESREVRVEGGSLLPSGDLLPGEKSAAGRAFDPMAKAAVLAPGAEPPVQSAPAAPADRHPIHLAEPVYLSGYTAGKGGLEFPDGVTLPLLPQALGPVPGITADDVSGSSQMVALLRFDAGRWHAHPLTVAGGGKKLVVTHTGGSAWEAVRAKKKTDTLGILRERASRLLRKKS